MLQAGPERGLTVRTQPSLMVIPPGQQQIKKIEVAAATVGPARLRLRLLTPEGVPSPAQATVIIQATHYGTLALVIIGTALGVFVLTAVTRAVRRGGRRPGKDRRAPVPAPAAARIPAPRPSRRTDGRKRADRHRRSAGKPITRRWRAGLRSAAPAHDAAEETDDYAWAPGWADPR